MKLFEFAEAALGEIDGGGEEEYYDEEGDDAAEEGDAY